MTDLEILIVGILFTTLLAIMIISRIYVGSKSKSEYPTRINYTEIRKSVRDKYDKYDNEYKE
jgi:hypothetical protein